MEAQNLKPQLRGCPGKPGHEASETTRLNRLMLALQRLTGTTLSGIAVGIQLGNVMVCLSMLILGPAVILRLLP
jgi:hypothetical protein